MLFFLIGTVQALRIEEIRLLMRIEKIRLLMRSVEPPALLSLIFLHQMHTPK